MKPCTRVGLDVTWRCNWRCTHCFYADRRNPNHTRGEDVPLSEVLAKLDRAHEAGLDHAVLVGYGEPTLCGNLAAIQAACAERDMAMSIITNGATGLDRFKRLYADGLDHVHLSGHGIGDTLDAIAQVGGAYERQQELRVWLADNDLPYRSNVTMQRGNYTQLRAIATNEFAYGVRHFVLLGFLPHYEWARGAGTRIRALAVHPARLRPHIESAAQLLLEEGISFTIRYHPFCHLDPALWPHVTNARYVFFDPWEWNYELTLDRAELWTAAVRCGDAAAKGGARDYTAPCKRCAALRHCGGWNRRYAEAFGGAGLRAIRREDVPAAYETVWDTDGGVFDLNPANRMTGTLRAARPGTQPEREP